MGRITIYIPKNVDSTYKSLQLEIKDLWYKKYGEVLSIGTMIIKALIYLRDSLNNTHDNKRQIVHKYIRTGSESE